jgi:hemoglobin/transferrin/lactoferrin receptor protein
MKKIFSMWLLFGVCILSYSQTITIKDSETRDPIELVTLSSDGSESFAITNLNGQADISAFKNYDRIEIRTLGYKSQIRSYSELQQLSFVVLLESSNLNLDEVVVSATRWRQTSGNVPSKIISISSREVALQNPQTAADMLSISGKVYVQKSQQGGGSPMIRGFATNRLLYTVDGVRMNNAIFRGGNIQNVISLDPFATENVEVLFGPGSVMYGSDAIGGVMSFQTLTPQLALDDVPLIAGKAVVRSASANNERTAHFDVNMGWMKWAFLTSISSWDYDHLRQGSHGPDDYLKPYYVVRIDSIDRVVSQDDPLLQIPSAYSQINLMQKVLFKPNDQWDVQYGFHYSETSPYGRYDRHNRMMNGTALYGEWDYGPQKWLMNNLNITKNGSGSFYDHASLKLAQQLFEESRISRNLNDDQRETRLEEVKAWSANLDFVKSLNSKHTLYYGFEYVLNDVNSRGIDEDISTGTTSIGSSRYPQSSWSSAAVYVNETYEASDKLTLQAGIRYNQFALNADFTDNLPFFPFPFETANIDDGSLTGSLGGVYRPNESWVISSNFGTAFRAPNVDDIGKIFDSEPGAVTVPNPELEAEYAYNYDLGFAKLIGESVKLDLTGYYTILKNAMVRRDFTLNDQSTIVYEGEVSDVQAIQNAAKANVYGLQAGLEVKLPEGFKFSSDLNYQVGEEELDDGTRSPSRHAAPMFGTTRLSFNSHNLNLQFYSTYQGERKYEDLAVEEQAKDEIYAKDSNGNNYSPRWYTLNFKAMHSLSDNVKISAGIENLTDQRYRSYSSGLSAPGRNFILSLRANF